MMYLPGGLEFYPERPVQDTGNYQNNCYPDQERIQQKRLDAYKCNDTSQYGKIIDKQMGRQHFSPHGQQAGPSMVMAMI